VFFKAIGAKKSVNEKIECGQANSRFAFLF